MTDEEIAAIATKLDEATQSANCVAKFVQHGGGIDASYISATRAGYLRLAALFLSAAAAPLKDEGKTVDVKTEDVIHEDSDVFINWFERDEDLQPPKLVLPDRHLSFKEKVLDSVSLGGCALLVIFFLAVMFTGLFTIISSFFRH